MPGATAGETWCRCAVENEIASIRADVEQRVRVLLNELSTRGLLTSDDVASLMASIVDVRIEDVRRR
jgi:hypothetical protein